MIPKFRAWHKTNKEMMCVDVVSIAGHCIHLTGNFLDDEGDTWCSDSQISFDEIELMQWSGLIDAENKEVYTGDIIEYSSLAASFISPETPNIVIRQEVKFEEGIFGTTFGNLPHIEPLRNSFKYNSSEIKVIGNIYENPELLNKEVINEL